jgi:fused signal recognition particle receptor
MSFFKKLKEKIFGKSNKLSQKYATTFSQTNFASRLKSLASRFSKINDQYFEEVEEILITADIGGALVDELLEEVKKECRIKNVIYPSEINEIIVDKMFIAYTKNEFLDNTLKYDDDKINAYLIVGVNGVGKTTTIAKLAYKFKSEGKKVLLVAADTFRAAAVEQLVVWAKRVGVDITERGQGVDPTSVIYDAAKIAKEKHYDILLIDTAGRMQNKDNLMRELGKIKKVISSLLPNTPQETLLIIDGTTGQSGLIQAEVFQQIGAVTGIVLTKMDGTSKGGIVLAIKDKLNLPVRYLGVGEKMEDLIEFDLEQYLYSLFREE